MIFTLFKRKHIALLFCIIFSSRAWALEFSPKDFVELDIFNGLTGITGKFSEQKNPVTWGFSVNIYFNSKTENPFPSYISIGNYYFSLVSNDASFPFPVNDKVSFSTNFLNLMLPFYRRDKFSLYFGIGYSVIDMTNFQEMKYEQNYGSSQYELQARYTVNEKYSLYYKTKWQQINQYQNDNFSFIEMWTHAVGFGYLLF